MDRTGFARQMDTIDVAVRSRNPWEALRLAGKAYEEALSRYQELLAQKRTLMKSPRNNFVLYHKLDVDRAIIEVVQHLSKLSDRIDDYVWDNNDKGGTR